MRHPRRLVFLRLIFPRDPDERAFSARAMQQLTAFSSVCLFVHPGHTGSTASIAVPERATASCLLACVECAAQLIAGLLRRLMLRLGVRAGRHGSL